MKKTILLLCVFGLMIAGISPVYAGGILNKQNLSAKYLKTLSRNAATDAADIVVYNPAGVMEMEDGTYTNLGLFYAGKDYSNTIAGTEYDQDEPSIVPGLFAVYKQDKWAAFGSVTIPQGGGDVDYTNGNATTIGGANMIMAYINTTQFGGLQGYGTIADQSLEGYSYTYGIRLGGAYAINDKLSIAGGVRYANALVEGESSVTVSPTALGAGFGATDQTFELDYEQTADGWCVFLGVNYAATDKLNIGFRYESNTDLEYENDVNKDDTGGMSGVVDGAKFNKDLPGLIGLGVSYQLVPQIKADISYTYYLEEQADWEGLEDEVENASDFGGSLEVTLNPEYRVSIGFMRTKTHISADLMSYEAPELDADSVCMGIAYDGIDNMTINGAIIRTMYTGETNSLGIELDKDVLGFGIGVEYKFM